MKGTKTETCISKPTHCQSSLWGQTSDLSPEHLPNRSRYRARARHRFLVIIIGNPPPARSHAPKLKIRL